MWKVLGVGNLQYCIMSGADIDLTSRYLGSLRDLVPRLEFGQKCPETGTSRPSPSLAPQRTVEVRAGDPLPGLSEIFSCHNI